MKAFNSVVFDVMGRAEPCYGIRYGIIDMMSMGSVDVAADFAGQALQLTTSDSLLNKPMSRDSLRVAYSPSSYAALH